MSEPIKKSKLSTESMIGDIATSIESIAGTLGSINKSHGNLLRLNKSVVALKLAVDKEKKLDLDTTVPLPVQDTPASIVIVVGASGALVGTPTFANACILVPRHGVVVLKALCFFVEIPAGATALFRQIFLFVVAVLSEELGYIARGRQTVLGVPIPRKIMEDKNSQAISLANSYFSLVDGLAPGFDNHLAENVVLDWFGRMIRGRKNVAEFMKTHKDVSRHVFNNISPIPDFDYGKFEKTNRKISSEKTDNYVSSLLTKELNFQKLSIGDTDPGLDPENNNVIEPSVNHRSTTYHLGENDLPNLFALEIVPIRDEDVEQDTNHIKRFSSAPEESSSSVKYVEANGHIEFRKKSNKRGIDVQKWQRQSRLQIAYSQLPRDEFSPKSELDECENVISEGLMETDEDISTSPDGQKNEFPSLLPSLNEITKISNNLVPNNAENNFGGYFPNFDFDFAADRNHFLDNFHAELNVNNPMVRLRTPQYVDNRLVFEKNETRREARDLGANFKRDQEIKNGFVFRYLIHSIIYQSNSKCRRSLSGEFEFSNKNKKHILSGIQEI